jgi:Na+/melibiose symporter-like transporter
MKDSYAMTQRVLGGLLCAVGVAMVVATLAGGGGLLALGLIVGVLFVALGAARIWLVRPRHAAGAEAER